ncbi:MAG TPA: tRNA lysidine(34) synthetase TilS [Devosia sp.]|nr:tRNA lysidine(34) synthetase TilS [Devosia sp.]
MLDLPSLFAPIAHHPVIGLAVSGGADSLALMLMAAEWASGLASPPRLVVYSVDHGLRAEAAGEVAFVLGAAARLGLAGRGLRWEGEKPSSGVQASAREVRYRLMGAAMAQDGANVLLTAHHRNDQAETVLMRLAHGSGLDGLRGMSAFAEVEGVPVFRPLLGVPPEQLRAVVAAAGLAPVADPSNADEHYERVRWRGALPLLDELGLDAGALARFARRAGEADDAIALMAEARLRALAVVDGVGAVQLPAAEIALLPRSVGVKLLLRLLDRVGGGQKPRALGQVERLFDELTASDSMEATLLGARLRRRGAMLLATREPGRQRAGEAVLDPQASLVWDGRFRVSNGGRGRILIGAAALSRPAAELLVGRRLASPASAIRSAPLVRSEDGAVLALGAHHIRQGVSVEFSGW